MEQLKQPTSLISHWFPVEMDHNRPKLCKFKCFFLRLEFFWGIQGMPTESWRPWLSENLMVFYAMIFLNWSYGCSKLGPNWRTNFFERRRFFSFSVFDPRNNVRSLRLDNFEATGRAHSSFEGFYPYFWGNISKLAPPLKFGVPGHSEVRQSIFVSAKNPCLMPNSWTKT